MKVTNVEATVSGDQETASLEITTSEDNRFTFEMTTAMIEVALGVVATARSNLLPSVPWRVEDAPMNFLGREAWIVHEERFNGDRTLCIRHPAIGWIALGLSADDAAELARRIASPDAKLDGAADGG